MTVSSTHPLQCITSCRIIPCWPPVSHCSAAVAACSPEVDACVMQAGCQQQGGVVSCL
jgi:hypothetical protein